ncbi:MAG: YopX family protein, partial [Christensenellales bacterium]
QYTGLTDKNGNKIFDGDIVVFSEAECPETERAIVVYDDGGYKLKYLNYDYMDNLDSVTAESQVIVGNIHDNPELLEV